LDDWGPEPLLAEQQRKKPIADDPGHYVLEH